MHEVPAANLPITPNCIHCHCRATFDTDNIDVGPERRAFLDHRLSRVWEVNSQVSACTWQAASAGFSAQFNIPGTNTRIHSICICRHNISATPGGLGSPLTEAQHCLLEKADQHDYWHVQRLHATQALTACPSCTTPFTTANAWTIWRCCRVQYHMCHFCVLHTMFGWGRCHSWPLSWPMRPRLKPPLAFLQPSCTHSPGKTPDLTCRSASTSFCAVCCSLHHWRLSASLHAVLAAQQLAWHFCGHAWCFQWVHWSKSL